MADRVDRVMKQQGRSRRELVREALLVTLRSVSGDNSSNMENSARDAPLNVSDYLDTAG